jgi:hypothetical protein
LNGILMGVESEYAAAGPPDRSAQLQRMILLGREHLECLPGTANCDLFLGNGSRIYLDCLEHPEVATPECTNPADVVCHIAAGERVLERLCELYRARYQPAPGISLYKTNVDYSGAGTTWGCHESYLSRKAPPEFVHHLVPHLVSRIIYSGAGGFNPLSAGLQPALSPRVYHLQSLAAEGSTGRRPIFHTKDERLTNTGYHRIHLICGESLCSHVATYLKCGATALVVALIDHGGTPGIGVQLTEPLAAMRLFTEDETCRRTARVKGGNARSALEIQRHYLQAVKAQGEAPWLPVWAGDVLREWEAMLERLERAPDSVQTRLDWAIKLALFKEHAAHRGLAWDKLPVLSEVSRAMAGAKATVAPANPLELAAAPRPAPNPAPDRAALAALLHGAGLDWEDFEKFRRARAEFFEIDLLYGQVGATSLFATLDAAGVLQHAAPGDDGIDLAVQMAPSDTRAHARGAAIRAARRRTGFRCSWQEIGDFTNRRVLSLQDPFAVSADWVPLPERSPQEDLELEFLRTPEALRLLRRPGSTESAQEDPETGP